jgi:hypothetical protein
VSFFSSNLLQVVILSLYFDADQCLTVSTWLIINAIRISLMVPHAPLKWYSDRFNSTILNARIWNYLHFMGFIWFIYGNYVLINYQECRIQSPALFFLVLASVLITYLIFVMPFLVLFDLLTLRLYFVLLCFVQTG